MGRRRADGRGVSGARQNYLSGAGKSFFPADLNSLTRRARTVPNCVRRRKTECCVHAPRRLERRGWLRRVQRNKRRAPGWGAAQNKVRKCKDFSGPELRASARHRQAVGGQAGRAAKLAEQSHSRKYEQYQSSVGHCEPSTDDGFGREGAARAKQSQKTE
jgi:chromosome condensin MukBEF ATPase and DNA-binding subunit MukB